MKYDLYKFKFYLNASHLIYLNGVSGEKHPHTWEITIDTLKISNDFIQFHDIEKFVEDLLEKYQNQLLNEIEPFVFVNPILENICEYFKIEIQKLLTRNGWFLTSIEISETPTRSYIIDIINELNYDTIDDVLKDEGQVILEKTADEKIKQILSMGE